jgi:dTDP-4-amino-4,6-dideoxygalactose transaminase
LRKYLAARGIETTIYYPLSLHLQEVYNKLTFRRGDFPESEAAQDEVMSLPMYPEITEDQVRYIVNTIREFFDNQKN